MAFYAAASFLIASLPRVVITIFPLGMLKRELLSVNSLILFSEFFLSICSFYNFKNVNYETYDRVLFLFLYKIIDNS